MAISAAVPFVKSTAALVRLYESEQVAQSEAFRLGEKLQRMMGEDGIRVGRIYGPNKQLVRALSGVTMEAIETIRVSDTSEIDGVMAGIVGTGDTMSVHVQDDFGRKFVFNLSDESLAKKLIPHWRGAPLRFTIAGYWLRKPEGWIPESGSCKVLEFTELDFTPLGELFKRISEMPGNGWNDIADPEAELRKIRYGE